MQEQMEHLSLVLQDISGSFNIAVNPVEDASCPVKKCHFPVPKPQIGPSHGPKMQLLFKPNP